MGTFPLSHRERMQALLSNQPLDRLPVAMWRHFPVDDQDPYSLAAATLHYQNTYDFDLVKVTPASSFCLKDWGAEDRWEGNPEGTRFYSKHVIQSPQDWENLPVLHPSSPYLAQQLKCLAIIKNQLDGNTPILQTIFNPLAQAKNLAGGDLLLVHMRKHPEAVLKGLEIITKSTQTFLDEAIQTGIDGVFYAIQHAQAKLLTTTEYEQFGKPYDLQLLDHTRNLWCNLLHLHGSDVYFDMVTDYPINIINWHDRDTHPSLKDALPKFKGILCGGLKRETIALGTSPDIGSEIRDSVSQVGGNRFLLGTGCVVPIIAPHGNILAARRFVESL
jgi:uroporphyrinogen decarboxylase